MNAPLPVFTIEKQINSDPFGYIPTIEEQIIERRQLIIVLKRKYKKISVEG